MATFNAGEQVECFVNQVILHKTPVLDSLGNPVLAEDGRPMFKSGFKIAGGIDQDNTKSPQGYPDKGIYVTHVYEDSPAYVAGLKEHDKILQVNGHDMTMVTHKKAVDYITRRPVLEMFVYHPTDNNNINLNDVTTQQQLQKQQQQPQNQQQLRQLQQQNSSDNLINNHNINMDRVADRVNSMKVSANNNSNSNTVDSNFDLQRYVHQQQNIHQKQQQPHQQQQYLKQPHQQLQQPNYIDNVNAVPHPNLRNSAKPKPSSNFSNDINSQQYYPPQQIPQKLASQQSKNSDFRHQTINQQSYDARFEQNRLQRHQQPQQTQLQQQRQQQYMQQQQQQQQYMQQQQQQQYMQQQQQSPPQQLQQQRQQQQFQNNQFISGNPSQVRNPYVNNKPANQFSNRSPEQYSQHNKPMNDVNDPNFRGYNQQNFQNYQSPTRRN